MKNPKKIKLPVTKRIFDLAVSFILLLITVPFLIFIFLWILLEQIFIPGSRGPILYKETRISQGKKFKFYKFRIFKKKVLDQLKDTDCIHTKPLEKNKKNLTFYGRFLKQIYMDELPQLWNIIIGDMTMVGPRPTNVENSKMMRQQKNFNNYIMKCGLTGPFQSEKGSAIDQTKVDREYIKFIDKKGCISIFLKDVWILFKTLLTVIKAKGI
ncbi:MAG: hypothetical protein GF349_04615 [Candidatus Magasanikbacteria bacterium]|nr:hypothetical protein [Candidatus Magasanikbacteria bacterium]